jgi:hypothetical protein
MSMKNINILKIGIKKAQNNVPNEMNRFQTYAFAGLHFLLSQLEVE